MMNLDFIIVGKDVIEDKADNSMSVISIIDGITVRGLPFVIQQLGILIRFSRDSLEEREGIEYRMQISVGDTVLIDNVATSDFRNTLRNSTRIRVNGLVIPHAGDLRFAVFQGHEGENKIGEYTIKVKNTAPQPEIQMEQIGEQPQILETQGAGEPALPAPEEPEPE